MPGTALLAAGAAYLGFATLAIALPGVAVQRLLRVPVDPALVLPAGLGVASALYWLSLASGAGWLFPAGVALLNALLLVPPRRWRLAEGPGLVGALAPFAASLLLLAVTAWPHNRILHDGRFAADGLHPGDAAFHVGLAWELTHSYPPETPGLAGVTLGYHLGQPLQRAAAARWAGIHPYDLISRFENTLGALALILALRAAARAAGAGSRGVALAGFAPLIGDLAAPFAWGRGIEWWLSLFESGAGVMSLAQANSLIPALAMALGALVAVSRWEAGEGRGWLALAAALGVATAYFKVFVAAQLLAGLGIAALASPRRLGLWLAAAPAALAGLGLVAGAGGETVGVTLAPLAVVRDARADLGFERLDAAGLVAWSAVWLLAALGLRLAGVPAALGALLRGGSATRALAVMALSGWPLGLLLRISPFEAGQRLRPFNEALYFFEQSGIALWVFAAVALGGLRLPRARAAIALGAGLALALPTTIQFALRKSRTPSLFLTADAVAAASSLERASRPGDVVLQRPGLQRFPPAPLVLVPRRVPYTRFIPFFSQILPRAQRRARFEETRSFFTTRDPARALEVAQRLGAGYVFLYGRRELRFDPDGILEPIYEAERARVYRILR